MTGEAWTAIVRGPLGNPILEVRGVPREVAEAAVIGALTSPANAVGYGHPESWLRVCMWSEPWAAVRR